MAQVRAKFYVSTLEPWHSSKPEGGGGAVKLRAVYSNDPNHENKQFWDATPNGEITLGLNNPVAFKFFHDYMLGHEFYIDFIPVAKEAEAK